MIRVPISGKQGKPDDAELVALLFNMLKVSLGYVTEGDVLVRIIMCTQFFGLLRRRVLLDL